MPKRILASLLAVLLVLSVPAFAAADFTDLPKDHWAYSFVTKLVDQGTVNGYDDGTFKPSGILTRAEFVKMMGVGTVVREKAYSDVTPDHWAYDYIMTSEMDSLNNLFEPSKPITREETIVLLYKRAGSPEVNPASIVVTNQAKNKNAVSWAYNDGIVNGDDGVVLRLNETLTRAEAATLIIRVQEKNFADANVSFTDVANKDLLKRVFESFDTEKAYSENGNMTIGELSRLALRIISGEYTISYGDYTYNASFEHEYAKDTAIMNSLSLGESKVDKALADKIATREDAVAILSAAFMKFSGSSYYGNGTNYTDIGNVPSKKKNLLSYAAGNGILLNGDGSLSPDKKATHKDIAALLLQFDELCGSQTVISTNKKNGKFVEEKIKLSHNYQQYPANHSQYKYIAADVPAVVYEREIKGTAPVDKVTFVKDYKELFVNYLAKATTNIKSKTGLDIEFVVYPNLVYDKDGKLFVRLLCRINGDNGPVPVNTVFSQDEIIGNVEGFIKSGSKFFIEAEISYLNLI